MRPQGPVGMCFSAASIEIGKTHESLAAEEGTTTVNGARLPAWVHCGAVGVFNEGVSKCPARFTP